MTVDVSTIEAAAMGKPTIQLLEPADLAPALAVRLIRLRLGSPPKASAQVPPPFHALLSRCGLENLRPCAEAIYDERRTAGPKVFPLTSFCSRIDR